MFAAAPCLSAQISKHYNCSMGGYGSGRIRTRVYLESIARLDALKVAELSIGSCHYYAWTGGERASVHRTEAGIEVQSPHICHGRSCHVSFVQVRCHFGGTRPLFSCQYCRQARRFLYLAANRIVCRGCIRANYRCQSLRTLDRVASRMGKLQRRLGVELSTNQPIHGALPARPRYMHSSTYRRLAGQFNALSTRRMRVLVETESRFLARMHLANHR